jgi:predicted DNA-binding protein
MNRITVSLKDLLDIDNNLYELRDALDNYNVSRAKLVLEDVREAIEFYISEIEEVQKQEEGR